MGIIALLCSCSRFKTKPAPPALKAQTEASVFDEASESEKAWLNESSPPNSASDSNPPPKAPAEQPPDRNITQISEIEGALAVGNVRGVQRYFQEHPLVLDSPVETILYWVRAQTMLGRFQGAQDRLQNTLERPGLSASELRALWLEYLWICERSRDWKNFDRARKTLQQRFALDLQVRGALVWAANRRGQASKVATRRHVKSLYQAYYEGQLDDPMDFWAVAQATEQQHTSEGDRDTVQALLEAMQPLSAKEEPEDYDAIALALSRLYHRTYREHEGLSTLSPVLERNPWHCDALIASARIELSRFELDRSDRAIARCLQLAADHPEALALRALLEATRGQWSKAIPLAERAGPRSAALAVQRAHQIWSNQRDRQVQRDAKSFHPQAPDYFFHLIELLVGLHLYPEAQTQIERALALDPNNGRLIGDSALNRLRLGQESRARRELKRAQRLDPFNKRVSNTQRLFDEFIDPEYGEIQIGQVWVRRPKVDAHWFDQQLREWIPEAIQALDRAYGIKAGPLRVEIYGDAGSFSVRNTGVLDLDALGVCFGSVLTVLGPYDGRHNFRAILWHELAHVYALRLSQGRVPRWFTEGLSEWEGSQVDAAWSRKNARQLRTAALLQTSPPFDALEQAFLYAQDPSSMENAYATAALALDYLAQKGQRGAAIAALRAFAQGKPFESVLPQVYGESIPALRSGFEHWQRDRLEREYGGWLPSPADLRPRDDRDRQFRKALRIRTRGQRERATALLYALVLGDGAGAAVELELSRSMEHRPDRAQLHAKKALHWAPHSVTAMATLAQLARDRNDFQEELHWWSKTLEADAMALEPALRALLLSLLLEIPAAESRARARILEISPLSTAGKLTRLLQAPENPLPGYPKKKVLAEVDRELRRQLQAGTELWLLAHFAFMRAGDRDTALRYLRWAEQSESEGGTL